MVQDVIGAQELKQDSMAVIHRVRPEFFELSLQGVGLQAGIKRVGSEEAIPVVGQPLQGRGQLAKRPLEMRRHRDAGDAMGRLTQASKSFNEGTDRVLPRRWARRPASTSSSTSWAVNARLCRGAPIRPSSIAFQGIRMTSSSVVTDTVGRRIAMRVSVPPSLSSISSRTPCVKRSGNSGGIPGTENRRRYSRKTGKTGGVTPGVRLMSGGTPTAEVRRSGGQL